ncbi:DUF4393 domain-containing protein [Shewanella sp. A32]|uniref:DUF4393 domain-containing protein n=1 Tax=Shewanella sp. A32 TaxID=3031327 RepID=UPI0023B8B705|nr:DUF4393 domain-containing protein [Shewanella sp. A32]MDF0534319.1 DUF4393 domain-containing protein [Shewanella sp. A32]
MPEEDPIKTAKEGVSVVAEIIKAAGDDPSVKEAAGNLGKTAVTLTKTINNALLPLAAINFAFDKARKYFSSQFQQDLTDKAKNIPEEHIVQPKASVAGPTLQGLAFTHDEANLKEMFLNLLATSMDGRKADIAHPAFVEIIKQLDSEDARLVQGTLKSEAPIPIVEIHTELKNGKGQEIQLRHLLNLKITSTGQPVEDSKLAAMVDNWIRLGLVKVEYDKFLTEPSHYSWVESRPEYKRLCDSLNNDERKVEYTRGIIYRTELGKRFAAAVGVN